MVPARRQLQKLVVRPLRKMLERKRVRLAKCGMVRNACRSAQPCMPGQIGAGSCQVQCASATAGAQNFIVELRSSRQERDQACLKDPASRECIEADADYDIHMSIYRNYLASVPIGCQSTLPDPIAI
jgi:hypothetical protein